MIGVLNLWKAIISDWRRRNFFMMRKFDRIFDASNHNERRFKQMRA